MLIQRLIPLTSQDEWNEALLPLFHGAGHTHAYNLALSKSIKDPIVLYAAHNDNTGFYAACPFRIRTYSGQQDLTTPYGLSGFVSIGFEEAFEEKWHSFCHSEGFICAYIHQPFEFDSPFPSQCTKPCRSFYHLDLAHSESTLFKKITPSYRYDIRQNVPQIDIITNENTAGRNTLCDALLILYPQTLARTGAGSSYAFSKETLRILMEDLNTVAIGAMINRQVVCLSLFLVHNKRAEYFLNASTQEGRQYSKNILWEAIKLLNTKKVTFLNLGGGIREDDSLAAFKRRFGAEEVKSTSYEFIFNNPVYRDLCRNLPQTHSPYFPAYYAHRLGTEFA